jgi:HSP20 family molecular chaperone IbpA
MLLPSIFRSDYPDDFMSDFFNFPSKLRDEQPFSLMKTDVKELENGYQIMIELPGYKKEDIEAEISDGYLCIQAERTEEKEEKKKGNYIRKERYVGSCRRRYYIGDNVTEEDIKASFEDGVLNIEVPKKLETKNEERKLISIQ